MNVRELTPDPCMDKSSQETESNSGLADPSYLIKSDSGSNDTSDSETMNSITSKDSSRSLKAESSHSIESSLISLMIYPNSSHPFKNSQQTLYHVGLSKVSSSRTMVKRKQPSSTSESVVKIHKSRNYSTLRKKRRLTKNKIHALKASSTET